MLLMFCFDPSNHLLNAILEIVADMPSLPVRELHARLCKEKNCPVTIQHLYRTLNRMIEAQMLLKDSGKVTLNRIWLGQLGLFASNAALHLEKDQLSTTRLPLREGECVVIRTDSLIGLQAMWYHTLAKLHAHLKQESNEITKYYSHAWWLLEETDAMKKFLQAVSEKGVTCQWLLGNDTVLDRSAVEQYKNIFEIRIAKKSPFPIEGYCLNVYGEYILECMFPRAVSTQFQLLFSTAQSENRDTLALLRDLSTLKARYSMKLWRNKELAEEMRSKVKRFF